MPIFVFYFRQINIPRFLYVNTFSSDAVISSIPLVLLKNRLSCTIPEQLESLKQSTTAVERVV